MSTFLWGLFQGSLQGIICHLLPHWVLQIGAQGLESLGRGVMGQLPAGCQQHASPGSSGRPFVLF
jgi:hypothetical protein